MPSDSGYASMKNRNSYIQWTPQHSLSLNDSFISMSMSRHLHSTSRRIFIGPTPSNWSYKKSSIWFSKSDQATHHKGPNRQRTFRAEPEVKGPTNMSSLDFGEAPDNHDPTSVNLTDTPFLFSEPEEIMSDHDCKSTLSSFKHEIFYTPNEEIRSFPNTPPQHDRDYIKWKNSPIYKRNTLSVVQPKQYFDFTPTLIENISEEGFMHENFQHKSSSSPNYIHDDDEIINGYENDMDNRSLNVIDHPVVDVNSVNSINLEVRSISHPVCEPDTIIKEDRMLIRVERLCHHDLPKRYSGHFLRGHTVRKHLTHSVGWKEYIVRLRPGRIELYKNNKVRFAKMRFNQTTRLTLFSAIDYTLTLKQKSDSGMKVFLINPKTVEQSVEWYCLLHTTLGEPLVKPMPTLCEVYVPDLDVHVRIPFKNCNQVYQITGEEITKLVLDELSDEPEWEDVLCEWLKSCDLRLCWKRYDRLEWIIWENNEGGKIRNDLLACPQFIEGTHQLQLRPTEHYPTSVYLDDGTKLYEPPPVEGYLIRVTNNKGKWKPKRLYFTSHDQYLFFLKPFATSPPPPPVSFSSDEGDQQNVQPLIYAIAPQSQEQCAQTDAFMKADMKRRIKQIINASAFINLIDVVEVKSVVKRYGITELENHGCPFEIVLNNGRTIVLQAYSRQTTDEWIKRLNELTTYWKARKMSDVQVRINTAIVNENNDHEDDDCSSQNELHSHWNNFQTYVNPTIWHWCILNGCRGITKEGLLYQKSHLHDTFRNYHHILTRGNLLYYKLYTRKINGVAKRRSFHKRCGCINLADCYVYSGNITEYDLLYSSSSRFSATNDGTHKLPRIYPDGMYNFDDDEECTFVIWQGIRTYYFGKDEEKKGLSICLKNKILLDHPGRTWVFRARSKVEREEWVWAINVEIKRAYKEKEKNKMTTQETL
ncbi:Pleckstrin homology domain-containing protein [Glomus cerebriforme]|uniref:Pleckstrin homology domain-containing protein n=1 Tax=Glomus cerebriforme TaxID=658196 RepID=A0A397SQ84_9GLOM|nr:Pleckstrin homology domain-containing protein [Glomus cerebriforme]